MYRVSAFLPRFAVALLSGAALATLWVNLAPASYLDMIEFRVADLSFPDWVAPVSVSLTPLLILTDGLMAVFVAFLAKELWEAMILDRGALRGRQAMLPLAMAMGGGVGGIVVWGLCGTVVAGFVGQPLELVGLSGWPVTLGADTALCFLIGRRVFGPGHPALSLVLSVTLLFDAFAVLGLVLTQPPGDVRLFWLALPGLAALAVWRAHGRLPAPGMTERQRRARGSLWPYVLAGLVSWIGVVLAGLPGALGLLPVIPAIAHADRSFGLFAEVEEIFHDPLNRLAQWLAWPVVLVLFLFGLLRGGIDLSAFAPETVRLLASLWLGRPLGILLLGLGLAAALGARRPSGVGLGDLMAISVILTMGITLPLVTIDSALPGGAVQEAARLGLAISLFAAPLALLLPRRMPVPAR